MNREDLREEAEKAIGIAWHLTNESRRSRAYWLEIYPSGTVINYALTTYNDNETEELVEKVLDFMVDHSKTKCERF
jgi:hypothetical protein